MAMQAIGSSNPSPLATLKHEVHPFPMGEVGKGSITEVINELISRANQPHIDAEKVFHDLVTGKSDNVHNVVLSVAKAEMTFRLALELRNRLMDAYQEISRMQV